MRERPREFLDHMPDPIAMVVREKWVQDGKARLKTPHTEVQKCQAMAR